MQSNNMGANVTWSTLVVEGPDGKPWVAIRIDNVGTSFVAGLPPDAAQKLASEFRDMVLRAVAEANALTSNAMVD